MNIAQLNDFGTEKSAMRCLPEFTVPISEPVNCLFVPFLGVMTQRPLVRRLPFGAAAGLGVGCFLIDILSSFVFLLDFG